MQASAQYIVSGEVLDVNYVFNDVNVELLNGRSKRQLQLSPSGQFRTTLQWNQTYYFKFRKTGYVSKVIEFSTVLPTGVQPSSIEPYHMPVRLFRTFDGVDTVFFKNPIAIIRYDEELGDFEHDMDYSLKVRYRIDKMRKTGEEKRIEKPLAQKTKPVRKEPPKGLKEDVKQVSSNNATENDELAPNFEEVSGLPILKDDYEEGETIEEFDLQGRKVKRHVFVINEKRRVFLSVKHNWGGHYYFIDEADIGYRCISRDMYDFFLMNYRNKIKNNK